MMIGSVAKPKPQVLSEVFSVIVKKPAGSKGRIGKTVLLMSNDLLVLTHVSDGIASGTHAHTIAATAKIDVAAGPDGSSGGFAL